MDNPTDHFAHLPSSNSVDILQMTSYIDYSRCVSRHLGFIEQVNGRLKPSQPFLREVHQIQFRKGTLQVGRETGNETTQVHRDAGDGQNTPVRLQRQTHLRGVLPPV